MTHNATPYKPRPPPGQRGSTPFRSSANSLFNSSLVSPNKPSAGRSHRSPTKPTKTPTGSRSLFGTTPRGQGTTPFAPDLPAEVTRLNPATRKFARRGVSTGMSNTASTEPFHMIIPSPDPDLTGEALAKEVPDDPDRSDSIYADEFLAHKCPPHFTDLERRQFFCILDLRRLKYAATEIFAKKDWKLNVLNFAREYEKSRSLILLRYGLYEFKSVKPSIDVLQKWRSAHGLQSESEGGNGSSRAKGTKRKADEDTTPDDEDTLMSGTNQKKRRNISQEVDNDNVNEATPVQSNKRKASVSDDDEEPDTQRAKFTKTTPSAATSIFESIVNKQSNVGTSPEKKSRSSLFGVSKSKGTQDTGSASKANPFKQSTGSLLFGSSKTIDVDGPATPVVKGTNSFKYVSESESSDDDDTEEPETNAEPPQPSTASKTGGASNIFGGASQPRGGLFDRVTLGPDNQPVRATPIPAKQGPENSTATPADYTFNPATARISFAKASTDGPETAVKATLGSSAKLTKPDTTAEPKKPFSLFGASPQTTPAPKLDMFKSSDLTKPKSSETSASILATYNAALATPNITSTTAQKASVSIFDEPLVPTPVVLETKPSDNKGVVDSAPAKSKVTNIFDQSFIAENGARSKALADNLKPSHDLFSRSANPLFGGGKATEKQVSEQKTQGKDSAGVKSVSDQDTKGKTPSIFDQSFIADNGARCKALADNLKPSHDMFSRSANPLFGGGSTAEKKTNEAHSKDASASGSQNGIASTGTEGNKGTAGSSVSLKASVSAAPAAVSIFDSKSTAAPLSTFLFGDKKADNLDKPASAGLFGTSKVDNASKPAPTNIFGAPTADSPAKPASNVSLFGAKKVENAAASGSTSLFADKTKDKSDKPDDKTVSTSLFGMQSGGSPTKSAATNIFGAQSGGNSAKPAATSIFATAKTDSTPKPAATSIFATANTDSTAKPASTNIFAALKTDSTAKPASTNIFAAAKTDSVAKPAATSIFATANTDSTAKPAATNIFAPPKTDGTAKPASNASLFGEQKTDNSVKSAPTIFSSAPGGSGSIFGSQSFTNTQTSSSVSFGATPATSVSFGGPGSQTSFTDPNKIDFQFTAASGPSGGSSSFTFGQDSSAGSGFTFTAGKDKGSFNNPFATTSQSNPTVSAPAFGASTATPATSSAPTPSFVFSSQTSAAPQVAPVSQGNGIFSSAKSTNGIPAVSFSQPQPSIFAASQAPAAPSIFSQLHAGGDASTGAGSPIPVPSSIGTTPMNGTPEPDAGQDGEEPREAQISLTEGGPGEEDEILVHEVRAKALKFVPAQAGEDGQEKKSTWSTQGVGPLRVLKNKTTGVVRMLLRAEPRGHIALNKTILADVQYTATAKSVKFVAAKDDGSGLETCLLQVKTPELAKELTRVLEENKVSNKK